MTQPAGMLLRSSMILHVAECMLLFLTGAELMATLLLCRGGMRKLGQEVGFAGVGGVICVA